MQGVVKWYVLEKGFGFVRGDDGADYFVRQENILTDGFKGLEKGSRVIFDLAFDEDGKLEATQVRPAPTDLASAGGDDQADATLPSLNTASEP